MNRQDMKIKLNYQAALEDVVDSMTSFGIILLEVPKIKVADEFKILQTASAMMDKRALMFGTHNGEDDLEKHNLKNRFLYNQVTVYDIFSNELLINKVNEQDGYVGYAGLVYKLMTAFQYQKNLDVSFRYEFGPVVDPSTKLIRDVLFEGQRFYYTKELMNENKKKSKNYARGLKKINSHLRLPVNNLSVSKNLATELNKLFIYEENKTAESSKNNKSYNLLSEEERKQLFKKRVRSTDFSGTPSYSKIFSHLGDILTPDKFNDMVPEEQEMYKYYIELLRNTKSMNKIRYGFTKELADLSVSPVAILEKQPEVLSSLKPEFYLGTSF